MPFGSDNFDVRRIDSRTWVTLNDLRYTGKSQNFMVPKYFYTDFASVPQFLYWLIPSTGSWTLAAVLHDWLIIRAIPAGFVTPRDTDGIFRRVLREQGVPFVTRWLMWTGVRWGALVNPSRRPGIIRDLPLMIVWSLVALPIVLPATVGIAFGYLLFWLLSRLSG